jgi:hypothetical protein
MPLPLPVWPPTFQIAVVNASAATTNPERWIIVDGAIRRDVSERDFRDALASCARIEVVRYPHEDFVTHICYR